MRGQLLFSPEKSQFVKDIINQVWEYKYGHSLLQYPDDERINK